MSGQGDPEGLDRWREPGLIEMAEEYLRFCSRWYGVLFMAVVLIYAGLGVWCAFRFLGTDNVPEMIRWGLGLLLCWTAVIGAKIWAWALLDRFALTREIKRTQMVVANLEARLRERPS